MIVKDTHVVRAGSEVARANAAVVMIHGRGATAEGMLGLAGEFAVPGIAYVAPQAATSTWYPYSFLAPLAQNEPALSEALATVDRVVADIVAQGVPHERIVLLGFSQGACLALEYAARNARRWGGVGRAERRPHRTRRDATRLRGQPRRDAGVSRLQRCGLRTFPSTGCTRAAT